jgi:hypothetical protein
LVQIIPRKREFKIVQIEGHVFFKGEIITKMQQEANEPNRSPESPWPTMKDFLFLYAFIFFCGICTQFYVMCKGGHCLVTQQAYTCDLGGGDLNSF